MDSIDDLSFVLDINDREKLYIAILTAQVIGVLECFASDNVVVCDDNTIAVDDQTDFDTKIPFLNTPKMMIIDSMKRDIIENNRIIKLLVIELRFSFEES